MGQERLKGDYCDAKQLSEHEKWINTNRCIILETANETRAIFMSYTKSSFLSNTIIRLYSYLFIRGNKHKFEHFRLEDNNGQ